MEYGYDQAYALAVQARAELVASVEGHIGITPIHSASGQRADAQQGYTADDELHVWAE